MATVQTNAKCKRLNFLFEDFFNCWTQLFCLLFTKNIKRFKCHMQLRLCSDKEKKSNYLLPLWNKSFICIGVDGWFTCWWRFPVRCAWLWWVPRCLLARDLQPDRTPGWRCWIPAWKVPRCAGSAWTTSPRCCDLTAPLLRGKIQKTSCYICSTPYTENTLSTSNWAVAEILHVCILFLELCTFNLRFANGFCAL